MHMRINTVTVEEAETAVYGDNVAFIDVRSAGEFAEGHAKGSQNIPLQEIANRTDELTEYDHVYLICRSGGRSAQAATYLAMDGVHAVNIEGGLNAWQDSALPVE